MTATLMLALLLQAQEPSIDDRIAAFVKGDAAARAVDAAFVGSDLVIDTREAIDKILK